MPYDFGDGWEHLVTVESFDYTNPIPQPIYCINAIGACPPEDVGGPSGYQEFCEAIVDPKNERHQEMMDGLEALEVDHFPWSDFADTLRINKYLKTIKLPRKRAPRKAKK